MAVLMRMLSRGASFVLADCRVFPDLPVTEPVPNGIGWVGRQFAACVGAKCPRPTQKTLAIIVLSKAAVPVATLPPEPPVDPVPAPPAETERLAILSCIGFTVFLQYAPTIASGILTATI